MKSIRLGKRVSRKIALPAGVATLFFLSGFAILVINAPSYLVLSNLAFMCALMPALMTILRILFRLRTNINRIRTDSNNLSTRLARFVIAQKETTAILDALTASQTRLWDGFQRSSNSQFMETTRPEIDLLSQRLAESIAEQKEIAKKLNSVTENQTRLRESFEQSTSSGLTDKFETQLRIISQRFAASRVEQEHIVEVLNSLTASQTRLWDEFERSNKPQHMLKK